jgi:putative membrane protein
MQATDHLHEHSHDHEHEHEHSHLQDWAKTGVLLGLGAYFLYNIVTGNLTNYINVNFAWLSYLAVILFFALGGYSAYQIISTRGHHHDAHDHHDHDHEHGGMSWGVLAIVALPLVLGTLVPSRPLGSAAVDGNFNFNGVASTSNMSTLTGDPSRWNVLEWIRAFNMTPDASTYDGQEADVIGFVYRDTSFGQDQFMVARFTISCCVADAVPIGLPVVWDKSADFPTDTWVRVRGNFQTGAFRDQSSQPVLHAVSVETVPQPEHPYLYP